MIRLEEIAYGTAAYAATVELRNDVMRRPLGRDIHTEDLSQEKDAVIIGAYDGARLIGTGVMLPMGDVCSLEFLCVEPSLQLGGIGGRILAALEDKAVARGASRMTMHARVSAKGFYERQGYADTGEECVHRGAPVPHLIMEKHLGRAE